MRMCKVSKTQTLWKVETTSDTLPWSSISMDFIEQLPASKDFSAILVVVDCLMKQVIFIPSHDTMNTLQVVQLFLTHVFSKHGVPSHVTLDQGSEFVSHFFHSLGKLLQMRFTTWKGTDRQSVLTRSWNNTCGCIRTTSRTIG